MFSNYKDNKMHMTLKKQTSKEGYKVTVSLLSVSALGIDIVSNFLYVLPDILFYLPFLFFFFPPFIFISWRLITLQYCSSFCHTLAWVSHGFTCVPLPDPLPTSRHFSALKVYVFFLFTNSICKYIDQKESPVMWGCSLCHVLLSTFYFWHWFLLFISFLFIQFLT